MIIGGNFVGKGAEAMMFVVRDSIKAAFPNAELWMRPLNEPERLLLIKHGFQVIKPCYQNKAVRFAQFVLAALGLFHQKQCEPEAVPHQGIANIFQISNVVVDISGFSSSDQFGAKQAYGRWRQYCMAKCSGNTIIFLPQSWGPFENKSVRFFTTLLLKYAGLVCSREKISTDHLLNRKCVDLDKLLYSPDIAFQFQAGTSEEAERCLKRAGADPAQPFITITPNMRIFERTTGKGYENTYFRMLQEIITFFLHKTAHQVVLIPHEASFGRANDMELCRMLIDSLAAEKNRIFTLAEEATAKEVKAVIGLSDFLVASRYHSLIGALSKRVPVAVIGWSHKYDELMGEVGLADWVADPVRRVGENPTALVMKAWENRDGIRENLQSFVPALEQKSHAALERMLDIIRAT